MSGSLKLAHEFSCGQLKGLDSLLIGKILTFRIIILVTRLLIAVLRCTDNVIKMLAYR